MKFIHFHRKKYRFIGRRAGVFDTVFGMESRGDTPQITATELDLPIEAIFEAIDFVNSQQKKIK